MKLTKAMFGIIVMVIIILISGLHSAYAQIDPFIINPRNKKDIKKQHPDMKIYRDREYIADKNEKVYYIKYKFYNLYYIFNDGVSNMVVIKFKSDELAIDFIKEHYADTVKYKTIGVCEWILDLGDREVYICLSKLIDGYHAFYVTGKN